MSGAAAAVTTVTRAERPLAGTCRVPGDKSISHRAALLATMAEGRSLIRGFSPAGDCGATVSVLAALRVRVRRKDGDVEIEGAGARGPAEPPGPLDCRRSGTTMRLAAGLLAAAPFRSVLTGDEQLLRPMARVAEPLRRMGARVALTEGGLPPMAVEGGGLAGIEHRLPVASAQVKSAVLLAGLRASGETTVVEPVPSRDHTERLLEWLGVAVAQGEAPDGAPRITVRAAEVPPFDLAVPGDLSSAAVLIAAAALVPGSDVVIREVGLNPTRVGFLGVLRRMGARVEARPAPGDGPEPWGDVRVRHAPLAATVVEAGEVPGLIDELPLLGLVASQAEGVTEVRGAAELRAKESDRIAGLVAGLRALGAEAEEREDGFAVRGPTRLRGGACDARADHRLAMTFAVAGLVAPGPVAVQGMDSVADSFPGFLEALGALR